MHLIIDLTVGIGQEPNVTFYKSIFPYVFLKPFSKFKNSRLVICESYLINAETISLSIIHFSIYVPIHPSVHLPSVRNFTHATFFGQNALSFTFSIADFCKHLVLTLDSPVVFCHNVLLVSFSVLCPFLCCMSFNQSIFIALLQDARTMLCAKNTATKQKHVCF